MKPKSYVDFVSDGMARQNWPPLRVAETYTDGVWGKIWPNVSSVLGSQRTNLCRILWKYTVTDSHLVICMLIFDRSYDDFMILSYNKVIITNNFRLRLF